MNGLSIDELKERKKRKRIKAAIWNRPTLRHNELQSRVTRLIERDVLGVHRVAREGTGRKYKFVRVSDGM